MPLADAAYLANEQLRAGASGFYAENLHVVASPCASNSGFVADAVDAYRP